MPPILYEDEFVLVLDKPAGLAVHPGSGDNAQPTIASLVAQHTSDDSGERAGIVHRLDKDTSGVLIVAKTTEARLFLQQQFKKRSIQKTYIALIEGTPRLPEAILDWPIGRHPKNPLKRAVVPRGKSAQTHYKILEVYGDYSLIEVYPKTGRTHQIRVHMSHLGHPIVGDSLYNTHKSSLKRQFLHAARISFKLPDHRSVTVESKLPADLSDFLSELKSIL